MSNVEKIKPTGIFTNYIFKAIPLAFDESMSYYETLCGVLDLLKNTVDVVNNNAELLEELDTYVKTYFDNLDVQDEINNKLDEMAESGQLEQIIAEYLNTKAIFGFNNIDEMKSAENLINGSFAKTLGKINYNDGLGQFYKIREISNQDIIDNITIIALNDENLIAELIPKNVLNVKYFGATGNGETDDFDAINKTFEYAKSKNIFNIYVPKGTYLLSNQLKMFSNLNLYGNGETSLLKAINFSNQNSYKSMIILENMPMDELLTNNVKNISIKSIALDNNGLSDAGKDGLIQFRGVRSALIDNVNITVNGNNCWGIILFSSNHNVKVNNVTINNISADNSLGGCLWVRNGVYTIDETTKTKDIFITNCNFTSSAKDEIMCISDGVDGGWTECEVNNISITGNATTNLPNFLYIMNTVTANGYIKVSNNNIFITGNANTYGVLCKSLNNDYEKINTTNNNFNINMTKGGGIIGFSRSNYVFNNCSIKITENKRACFGIVLTNSFTNSTCEASRVKNCIIESGSRNCCEDCIEISNSLLKSSNKGVHSYGHVRTLISNNEIYANVNAIHLQNNGTNGAYDTIIIGNYMQRLDNTTNTGSIAISVPNIATSRSLANRYLIKSGSTTGESYGFNYYDNTTGSSNYIKDDNETNI